MDWPIFFTILSASVAIIAIIYQFLRNFKSDINSHIDRLDNNMENSNKRHEAHARRMDQHAQRIDQLYMMFVDLLQARK